MVRTQIQLPDELYDKAKRFADEKEISMTELVRRGLETILSQYPPPEHVVKEWSVPTIPGLRILVPLERVKEYAHDDETFRSMVAEDE